jgi:hypothetical protein
VQSFTAGGVVILTAPLERIAQVVSDIRPDWPYPSIVRAICSCDGKDPAAIALAAVRVAADPESKSPTRITLPGPWWKPSDCSDKPATTGTHLPPPFQREQIRAVPPVPEYEAARQQYVPKREAVIRATRQTQPAETPSEETE